MPIDYSKGKIYTIRYKKDPTLIYVGSTVCDLQKRMWGHRASIHKEKDYNMMLYKKMRETDDIDNWYIELYEEFPCDNKEQLHKREGEIIRDISTLNVRIAGRTKQEYREDNKEIIKERKQKYYVENKDKINDKGKMNYIEKKEEYLNRAKTRYENKKEEIIKKTKEHYEANKEHIQAIRSQKLTCECGCLVRYTGMSAHKKTKKHLDLMNQQQAATN